MSNSFWQKIDEIFPLVADLPENAREAAVTDLCGGDEKLRREILALLAADKKAHDFCENPPALSISLTDALAKDEDNAGTDPHIGERLGAYRIHSRIGAGGMGAVYLATRDDGAFRKKVAVKLIRRGASTDFNLLRFRRERQILAALEHPFIARLLDAGATRDGLPYFVMEYVEGKTLFDFCDSRRLDLNARLRLFRRICAAVAYAHEKGIVHRDLKPGNILVTENAAVKLLDFGIARILDERLIDEPLAPTETLWRQLTPEYASPEQIKGERVAPSSDIYSLGVILYELTTGKRPYKFASRAPHEIARAICEDEVSVPNFQFKAPNEEDLKFIILKSMEKNPAERFCSVEALDAAVESFLEGSSVRLEEARRDFSRPATSATSMPTRDGVTAPRVTEKIQESRKLRVRAVFIVLAAFVFSALYAATSFNSLKQQPSRTTASPPAPARNEKPRTLDGVADDFYLAGKGQMEKRTLDGINKAIEFFNEAVRRDPQFAHAFSSLADAHILRAGQKPNENDYRQAEAYAMKALALDPDLAAARVSLGMSIYRNGGNFEQAEKHFLRSFEIDPTFATAHHWYAVILEEIGRNEDARREIEIAAQLEPQSAVIQHTLAAMYMKAGRYAEAVAHFDKAIESDNTFIAAYYWKSLVEQYQGNYEAALETYRKARIYGGKNDSEPLLRLMSAEADAAAGRREEALGTLKAFFESAEFRRAPAEYASEIALVYHLSGDDENAFKWLERVKLNEAKQAAALINDPRFERLHADARFAALTERWQSKK